MKVKTTSSFYVVNIGVFDFNQVVELNDELAKRLIEQGVVVEHIDDNKLEKKEEVKQDYNKLTIKELKELLQKKGIEIPKGAKKADLINLLNN